MIKWSNSPFLKSEDYERPTLEASSAIAFLSSLSLQSAASASHCSRQLTALDPCSNPIIQQSNRPPSIVDKAVDGDKAEGADELREGAGPPSSPALAPRFDFLSQRPVREPPRVRTARHCTVMDLPLPVPLSAPPNSVLEARPDHSERGRPACC